MSYNIYADIIEGSTYSRAQEDMSDFNRYHNGDMSIEECFNNFKERYKTRRAVKYLDPELDIYTFKAWINSLGYRR